MQIRKLEEKDVELMLEWMCDEQVVQYLLADFSKKSKHDCQRFINKSQTAREDLHLAIVDDDDVYMGTVSLKNIDLFHKNAEFAIVVRRIAMGKGYSIYGMREILERGKNNLGLKDIYWCVLKDNLRALSFYDKNRFERCICIPANIIKNYPRDVKDALIWYHVHF